MNGDGKNSVFGHNSGVKKPYVLDRASNVALTKFSRVLVLPLDEV